VPAACMAAAIRPATAAFLSQVRMETRNRRISRQKTGTGGAQG
jgi:hypothetical protein